MQHLGFQLNLRVLRRVMVLKLTMMADLRLATSITASSFAFAFSVATIYVVAWSFGLPRSSLMGKHLALEPYKGWIGSVALGAATLTGSTR